MQALAFYCAYLPFIHNGPRESKVGGGVFVSNRESGDHQEVVYGIHSVREAVRTRPVDFVMITQGYNNPRLQEIVDACRAAGISLRFSPRPAVERTAGNPQHQNVVAVCTPKAYDDISDLVAHAEHPLLVALDGVEDPANLGAIIRTVVATGAGGVVIPERRAGGTLACRGTGCGRRYGTCQSGARAEPGPSLDGLEESKPVGLWI